jgi:hypothetical protein
MKAAYILAGALAACASAVLLCGCMRTPAPAHPGGHAPVRLVLAAAAPAALPAPAEPKAASASPPAPAIAAPAAAAGANPFGPISWQPPAPAQPPAAAPSAAPASVQVPAAAGPPIAPPLPFRFLGRYGDGQVQSVMLAKGERLYLARPGDTIDGAYRIDAVTAQSVELTYLPMQLKQSLGTGDAG